MDNLSFLTNRSWYLTKLVCFYKFTCVQKISCWSANNKHDVWCDNNNKNGLAICVIKVLTVLLKVRNNLNLHIICWVFELEKYQR